MGRIKSIVIADEGLTMIKVVGAALEGKISGKFKGNPQSGEKPGGILEKLHTLFRKGKTEVDVGKYLDRVDREPGNTEAHLRLAKTYEKRGDMWEATNEYLLAAASFTRSGHYPQALTVYKYILKQNPGLDKVELKIAEIYGKMGSLENAYSVYESLIEAYNNQGRHDKAQEVTCLMAELSMQKARTAGKVRSSTERTQLSRPSSANVDSAHISKSTPSGRGTPEFLLFNYNMGVACRQMGYIDEAIKQFRLALDKGQNPCEAGHLLGRCFWDKGLMEEARHSFEIALKVEGIPQEKVREIKDDLALIP